MAKGRVSGPAFATRFLNENTNLNFHSTSDATGIVNTLPLYLIPCPLPVTSTGYTTGDKLVTSRSLPFSPNLTLQNSLSPIRR